MADIFSLSAMLGSMMGVTTMLLGLVLLILVHEAGHWLVARYYGFKTPVFSIGFGTRNMSWVLGTFWETEFRITPFLLGGYVSIPELQDESTMLELQKQSGGDASKVQYKVFPVYQRMLVAIAGIVMNVLTALVIFAALFFFVGKMTATPTTQVAGFAEQVTIARDAGVQLQDVIVTVNGVKTDSPQLVMQTLQTRKNLVTQIGVNRGGSPVEVSVTPNDKGQIGIAFTLKVEANKLSFGSALVESGKTTYDAIAGMFHGLGMMVGLVEKPQGAEMRGLIGIVQMGSDAYSMGWYQFNWLLAMISLNLAVMNILPIPALDGGHMLFFTIEGLRGKPVNPALKGRVTLLFVAMLMLLFVYMTGADLLRIFGISF